MLVEIYTFLLYIYLHQEVKTSVVIAWPSIPWEASDRGLVPSCYSHPRSNTRKLAHD